MIFQPHRYARLERYFDGFAEALSKADKLVVVPVFAAWCETGKVGGAELAAKAGGVYIPGNWDDIAHAVAAEIPPENAVVAVLGAGDVEKVIDPLAALLCGSGR